VWAAVPVRRPAASAVAGATELAGAANEWKFFLIIFFKSAVITVLRDRDVPLERSCGGHKVTIDTALRDMPSRDDAKSRTENLLRTGVGGCTPVTGEQIQRVSGSPCKCADLLNEVSERGTRMWYVQPALQHEMIPARTQYHRHAHRPSPTCNAFTRHFRMEQILKC